MVVHIFLSHTKLDSEFCDRFDIASARVGVRVFRSEYETIEPPAWETIKNQMNISSALFLLVGKELVKAQASSNRTFQARDAWKHTQNWIAYEVGLACQKGIDIWVVCDDVGINFPVPYLNNYVIGGLRAFGEEEREIGFMRWVLEEYNNRKSFPLGWNDRDTICPYKECQAQFNLHTRLDKKMKIICPTCLQTIVYDEGWMLDRE